MRVLQIVADGSPGGGTTHVLQILGHAALSQGSALITQPGSYLAAAARAMGHECIEMDLFGVGQLVQSPRRLRRAIDGFGPDLIHAHGSRAGFLTALADAKVGFVYTAHGLHFLHRSHIVRWLGTMAERVTNQRSDLTIYVSNSDWRKAESLGLIPRRHLTRVIFNGIPLEAHSPSGAPVLGSIGFVGRLEPQKDPLLFLDVVERLPEFSATMVGAGSLDPVLRQTIARRSLGNVSLLGGLPHDETLQVMKQFGVLVFTSRWEGLPIAALEALALGVPVVAPNVDGLVEIIENEAGGLLATCRSADAIAMEVRRLAEDLPLRQRVIEEGQKRVREDFSEDHMLAAIKDAYESVLVAKAGRSSSGQA